MNGGAGAVVLLDPGTPGAAVPVDSEQILGSALLWGLEAVFLDAHVLDQVDV